jgi:TPR repeat protein
MNHGFKAIVALLIIACSADLVAAGPLEDDATVIRREEAERGDRLAQYLLGLFYWEGVDIPQDYVEAVKWFRKSAEQGLPGAQYMLGIMYALGQGVPLDFVRAHMWLNLSGARGYEPAKEIRDAIAKKMTPTQIADAQKLAREWRPASPPSR